MSKTDTRPAEGASFPDVALETPDGALLLVGEAGVMQWPE